MNFVLIFQDGSWRCRRHGHILGWQQDKGNFKEDFLEVPPTLLLLNVWDLFLLVTSEVGEKLGI